MTSAILLTAQPYGNRILSSITGERRTKIRRKTYPRSGAVDFEWASIEDLLEAGAHLDGGSGRQSVGRRRRRRHRLFSADVVVVA